MKGNKYYQYFNDKMSSAQIRGIMIKLWYIIPNEDIPLLLEAKEKFYRKAIEREFKSEYLC